jgi:hypothetical protein
MEWYLLAVVVVVLRMETVAVVLEQQQLPQLLQPQVFLILERQVLEAMALVMQAVAVLIVVLLEQ